MDQSETLWLWGEYKLSSLQWILSLPHCFMNLATEKWHRSKETSQIKKKHLYLSLWKLVSPTLLFFLVKGDRLSECS